MNQFKDNLTCVAGSICHMQVSFGLLLKSSLTSVATSSALHKYNWATFEEYNLTSVANFDFASTTFTLTIRWS